MTTRHHGETEAPAQGFEARIEDGFEWLTDHAREVLIGIGLFLIVGGAGAGMYEWNDRRDAAAHAELGSVEARYSRAMGAAPTQLFVVEPANADQAAAAREAALADFDRLAGGTSGIVPRLAALRAAELELDLGRLDAADRRIAALLPTLEPDDPVRAIAQRLQGFVLEEAGKLAEAADAYAAAGAVPSYPDRGAVWLLASELYARVGDADGELRAYQAIVELDPVLAERERIDERLNALAAP